MLQKVGECVRVAYQRKKVCGQRDVAGKRLKLDTTWHSYSIQTISKSAQLVADKKEQLQLSDNGFRLTC